MKKKPRKKKPRKKKKATNKRSSGTSIPKMSKTDAPPSRIRRVFSLVLKALFSKGIIGIVIGILGLFFAIWVLVTPRVFVYPRASLDPNNLVDSLFAVRNEGYLSVYDVKVSWSVKELKLAGDITVIGLGDYTNRFTDLKQVARVIAPGVEYSVPLPLSRFISKKIENADIAIVLSFRESGWLFWRRKGLKRLYRFVSTQGKNGQWHWAQQPINK